MECDLHGYELLDAIIEVHQVLEECQLNEDQLLDIVHGYSHGSVLRDYFRLGQFIREMAKYGYTIKKIDFPNPGKTRFSVN